MSISAQDLKEHRWNNRILIVKTMNINSDKFQNQLKEIENSKDDFIERKLVLYKIIDDTYEVIDFQNKESKQSGNISEAFASKFLEENVEFEAILIGLDGGIKLRHNKVLEIENLYNTIDIMPMRRSEINRKTRN